YDGVLDRWMEKIEGRGTTITHHDIDYWSLLNENNNTITDNDINTKYNLWTNNDTDFSNVYFNDSKTFWCLKQPANGVYGLYRGKKKGYFLYRENPSTFLTMTSQKTQMYKLSDTGI